MGADRPTPGELVHQEASLGKQTESPDVFKTSVDGLNQWLVEAHKQGIDHLPDVSFGDVTVSIQAGATNYSTPRSNNTGRYTHVELGFPSETPPDYIMNYADDPSNPTETVYAYVPIELVVQWAAEKGGARALPAHEEGE